MFEENNRTAKYDKFTQHTMIHEICLDCRLGWRIIRKRLVYAENVNKISGHLSNKYDTDILQSLPADLHNCQYINGMRIVGAIINPLFQCDERMIEAGLFTKDQFQSGKDRKEELLDCMDLLFERKSETVVLEDYGATKRSKKWRKIKDTRGKGSQKEMTHRGFDIFEQCNDGKYLSQMKPLKVLGAIDYEGNLKEPVYKIGPLTQRGANMMHGNNHANYVECQVLYNIVRYLQDLKEDLPAL